MTRNSVIFFWKRCEAGKKFLMAIEPTFILAFYLMSSISFCTVLSSFTGCCISWAPQNPAWILIWWIFFFFFLYHYVFMCVRLAARFRPANNQYKATCSALQILEKFNRLQVPGCNCRFASLQNSSWSLSYWIPFYYVFYPHGGYQRGFCRDACKEVSNFLFCYRLFNFDQLDSPRSRLLNLCLCL